MYQRCAVAYHQCLPPFPSPTHRPSCRCSCSGTWWCRTRRGCTASRGRRQSSANEAVGAATAGPLESARAPTHWPTRTCAHRCMPQKGVAPKERQPSSAQGSIGEQARVCSGKPAALGAARGWGVSWAWVRCVVVVCVWGGGLPGERQQRWQPRRPVPHDQELV